MAKRFLLIVVSIILVCLLLLVVVIQKQLHRANHLPHRQQPPRKKQLAHRDLPYSSNYHYTSTNKQSETSSKNGGTLTLLWRSAAGNLGWQPEAQGEINGTLQLFFEGLIKDAIDGTFTPWLATSWETNPAAATITFQLRKASSSMMVQTSTLKSPNGTWTSVLNSVKPYWESIEVVDEYTIKVQLKEWRNYLLGGFTTSCFMHSQKTYDEKGLDYVRLHPVGTGPFIFDSYEDGVETVGVKNTNYWNDGHPYVDKVIIKYIPDWSARKAAFLAGEGDFTCAELGKETYDLKSAGFEIFTAKECVFVLIPSGVTEGSQWADTKVRQAQTMQ
jgi:ABC-type transport system substrate-binding protein